MSAENNAQITNESDLAGFISRLKEDPALRDRLRAALADAPEGDLYPALGAFALQEGWTLTPDDFRQLEQQLAALDLSSGALDESDLEKVSGGVLGLIANVIVNGVKEGTDGIASRAKYDPCYNPSKKEFWIGKW